MIFSRELLDLIYTLKNILLWLLYGELILQEWKQEDALEPILVIWKRDDDSLV